MADPTVIIDLSSIAYPNDDSGDPPDWRRVEAAVDAWRADHPGAVFYGVLDNKTWYALDSYGQQTLAFWKRQRMARSVPWADPIVLDLAAAHPDSIVLTKDLYRDFRKLHPWLQGTKRMMQPVVTTSGLEFSTLDYSPIADHEVSWRVQDAGLKPRGLTSPEAKQALLYEWACSNQDCGWSNAPVIDDDPAYEDGRVCCPDCRVPARQVGDREITRDVVVMLADSLEVDRLPVADGTSLIVGRGRGRDRYDVRLVLQEDESNRVSRDHVQLTNRSGRLFAEDLESRNGTTLIRSSGQESRLLPGVGQTLQLTDVIGIASGALQIRPSGRKRAHGRYEPDLTSAPWAHHAEGTE